MTDSSLPPQSIGIVLVHGIGEQRRFEHISDEVKRLVAALSAMPETKVSVEIRTTQDSEAGAENESWRAEGSAPVKIHVAQGSRRFCLSVHEVWWADLDDKDTLWNRLRFWFWGLGFWGVKKFDDSSLPGAQDMQAPEFPPFPWGGPRLREALVRARLWGFANVFLLSALTVNLLNAVLRGLRLGQIPGPDVFYQFVGDVKLYQDRGRSFQGPLTDLHDPRRVAIRRRVVQVLVDVYRANYDRWYVLAHSLGSVVAWNGLMETAHSLPNYLTQETHAALKSATPPILGPRRSGTARPVDDMRPARPVWITDDDEVLYRDVLFGKLRGFVTYGSPLDKFAFLWRAIVPINKDTSCWPPDFEWINVYDHTDPVASELTAFSFNAPAGSPQPVSYPYKASRVLLLSHLKYLDFDKRRGPDQFVSRLVDWMLDGHSKFAAPGPTDRCWYRSTSPAFGLVLRAPWWIAGAAVFAASLAWLGVPALVDLLSWVSGLGFLEGSRWSASVDEIQASVSMMPLWKRFVGVLGAAAAVVMVAGPVRRLVEAVLDR